MGRLIKQNKGFTLVEIIVSLMLSLIIFTSSAGLIATLGSFRDRSLIRNELYESANFIQQMFEREFKDTSDIIGIKTDDGKLLTEIPEIFVEFESILLKRSHFILESSNHKALAIYKKDHHIRERKPLFIFKSQSLDIGLLNKISTVVGYESGTNLYKMALKKVSDTIYEIQLDLTFESQTQSYTRNFYVKLQEG